MAKFYFQASDSTQKALVESIKKRRELEPQVVNDLAQVEGSGSFQNALATEQPGLMSAQATMAPTQAPAPRPYETAGGDDYVPESPTSQSVIDALAQPRRAEPTPAELKPNVGQRANLWRTQEGNLSLNSEGTKSSSALDPLGREVLITNQSSSELTGPTMHLTKDQVADLDRIPGYADQLMEMFPNHTATERREMREGEAGDLALLGQVPWEMFEIAQGLVLDPLAQTAAELLPFTEGGSWDPREGFGLTIANEGLFATTEKFRDRPWWQELIYGVAFDPTMILGGLGLIKIAKKGAPLTYDVVSTAIRRYMMAGGEEVNEASVDAATKYVMKENAAAGAGSAQPEGGRGWIPRKPGTSVEYSPQEILRAGGVDIADDAPLPSWVLRENAEAYDAGVVKLKAEAEARIVMNAGEPGPVSASVLQVMRNVGDDPSMRDRILDQLLDEGADNAAKQQRWDAFLRTTVHSLNEARKAEGGEAYAGLYAPGEFGGVAAQMRVSPPGGALTVPPVMRPEGELPMATRSITGAADPPVGLVNDTGPARTAEMRAELYGDPRDEPFTPSILARVRSAYEEGQALFIDKFAAGNAASSRAQREFVKVINNFIEEDMARINAATREKWRAQGVPDNDIRVRRELVDHKTPGYERVRRMPAEFNFEYQATLGSGMPGAARNMSGQTLKDIKDIVKRSVSDSGVALRLDDVEVFLTLRHALNVIGIRELRMREKIRSTGGELPEITQNNMNRQQIDNRIAALKSDLSSHTITSTVDGTKTVTTQWDSTVEAATRVADHYRELLEHQVKGGMVKREVADSLQQNYPFYNPIKYVETQMLRVKGAQEGERALLPGVSGTSIGELAEEGLDADVVSPLTLLTNITTRTFLTVQRNKAMQALIPTLMFDPRNRGRVVKITQEAGAEVRDAVLRGVEKPWAIASKDKMVRVARMVNGEAEVWEIPENFERIVDSLIAFDPNMAERVFRTINKVPRSLFTAHNPVFFTYNFLHDTLAAFIVEGVMPWEVAGDLMRNIRDIYKTSPELNRMTRAGAQVGGFAGQDASDILRRDLGQSPRETRGFLERMGPQGRAYDELVAGREAARVARDEAEEALGGFQRTLDERETFANRKARDEAQSALARAEEDLKDAAYGRKRPKERDGVWHEEFSSYHKWKNWVTSPIRLVGNVAEAVENAPRRSVWKKVINEGQSEAEAAVRSRRVTVDFQRRGRAVGLADAMFLYTNAAIQGSLLPARAARSGWGPRFRMAGLSAMAVAAYMWNTQDDYGDAYDEMSAQDKYTKMSFMVGHRWNQYGHKVPVSVAVAPLLREFAMFTAPITFTMQKLRGRSEQAHWKQMWQSLLPTLNPTSHMMNFGGRDATFGWQGLPTPTTFGNMLTELYTNWDSFRNEPIVPPDMAMIPDERQHYDAYTSLTAREVGQAWNMSPKKIDHFLRMGALRDVIQGVDQVFRWFDKGRPDPEIEAMAYEFQNILEMQTPSDEELEASDFESADEWRSKNRRVILNEYIRESDTTMTSTEKRELMLALDEINKADRMYTVDGQPVPFATSMVNRVLRTQGGNKSRLGQMRATEEMAKRGYDIDVRQTRDAAGKLNVLMEQLRDQQLVLDSNLWSSQRPEGDGMTERVGTPAYMDAAQWRGGQRDKGGQYAMAMAVYAGELHQAAQLQGLDLKKFYGDDYVDIGAFQRDTGSWEDYKKLVATGVGAWDDTRTEISHLAAGYRGIQMTELQPGIPDFNKFFDQREDYEAMVVERYGDDMWMDIERDLTSSMTSTEFEYYNDMKHIREYWDISREFTDRIPDTFEPIWTEYLDGSQTARMVMKSDPFKQGVISYIQKQVDVQRQIYRKTHPAMDAVYIKWGYAENPVTYDGIRMKMWLVQNFTDNDQSASQEPANVQ